MFIISLLHCLITPEENIRQLGSRRRTIVSNLIRDWSQRKTVRYRTNFSALNIKLMKESFPHRWSTEGNQPTRQKKKVCPIKLDGIDANVPCVTEVASSSNPRTKQQIWTFCNIVKAITFCELTAMSNFNLHSSHRPGNPTT
jgi:hypothetical protein